MLGHALQPLRCSSHRRAPSTCWAEKEFRQQAAHRSRRENISAIDQSFESPDEECGGQKLVRDAAILAPKNASTCSFTRSVIEMPLIRTDARKTNASHMILALARSDERHAPSRCTH